MPSQDARNTGNLTPRSITPAQLYRPALTLHRGGLARRPTPLQLLDQGAKDAAIACKRVSVANSTAYPCRSVADAAQGSRFILRVVGKHIRQTLIGGGPVDYGERLACLVHDFNVRTVEELGRGAELRALLDEAA